MINDIKTNQILNQVQRLQTIIEQQGIQLSNIAAQMIEQHEKLNTLTSKNEYIGTKEFERRYNIKLESQKAYRGRIKNPLPFYQEMENGKISYKITEVEEWKSKQKVIRDI